MTATTTQVLSKTEVAQKIDRIAYQVYENNHGEKEIIIAGIAGNGQKMAERLAKAIEKIAPLKVKLVTITINKEKPAENKIEISISKDETENKVVVVVDDVLNSGKTLMYAIRHILQVNLKALRIAVLVDRDHKRFPVKVDYVGMELATTLQEHVSVVFGGKNEGVFIE
ncbi:MAG: Bifunctional protein pyrR [Bacteroidia bacterium]|nr:Bifunctional protein pyrR [Bacteroidia bacterium]